MKDLLSSKVLQVENETPGRIIRAFRKNFGITLAEVQEGTGISLTHLSAIENDKIELGIKRAALIAAFFGVRPEIILFPEGRQDEEAIKRARKKGAAIITKAQLRVRAQEAVVRERGIPVRATAAGARAGQRTLEGKKR